MVPIVVRRRNAFVGLVFRIGEFPISPSRESDERKAAGMMEASVYGYARVSAKDQNLSRQFDALRQFPRLRRIYADKASGRDFERPEYQRLMRRLRPYDVMVVTSIDRLGRSYEDIIEQWRLVTKDKQAHIVVLDMPLLDTRTREGGLAGAFLADMMLQILSYVAQVERENILQRQAEGIAAAKARGVRFGRPPIARPDDFADIEAAYRAGAIARREAAQALGVSARTFDRWIAGDRSDAS